MSFRLAWLPIIALTLVVCLLPACDDDDDDSAADDDDDDDDTPVDDDTDIDDDTADDDDDDSACDDTLPPVVWIPGIFENGDCFSNQTMRFASNDYCLDRLYAYDWNALKDYVAELPRFVEFVDRVLDETGAAQIDLVGHSLGAALGVEYLADPARAAKVAHYVQIGAVPCREVPTGVDALNISSSSDYVVGVCELAQTENIVFTNPDHLQTATSADTFAAVYQHFRDGAEPATTDIVPQDQIVISGKTVVYAVNDLVAGQIIQVYQYDPLTGQRLDDEPLAEYVSDDEGVWGDFIAEPGAYYEFVCRDPEGFWSPLHYYREPFIRSNNKVYFRVYPEPDTILGLFFRLLPLDDSVASFSTLHINQSVVAGRDTFTVNGLALDTPEIAAAQYTTLVVEFGDFNMNGLSDDAFYSSLFPNHWFIQMFDLLIGAAEPQPIQFVFNERTITIPNWKSKTEGLSVIIFE